VVTVVGVKPPPERGAADFADLRRVLLDDSQDSILASKVAFTSDVGMDVVVNNRVAADDVFLRVTESTLGSPVLSIPSGTHFPIARGIGTTRVLMKGNVLEAPGSILALELIRQPRISVSAVASAGPSPSQGIRPLQQQPSPGPSPGGGPPPIASAQVTVKPRMFLFFQPLKPREKLGPAGDPLAARAYEADVPIEGNTPRSQPRDDRPVELLERILYLSRNPLSTAPGDLIDAFDTKTVLEIRDSTDPDNILELQMATIANPFGFRELSGRGTAASILALTPTLQGGSLHINGRLQFAGNLEVRARAFLKGESSKPEDKVFSNQLIVHVNRQVTTNHGVAQFHSGSLQVLWFPPGTVRPAQFLDPGSVPRALIQLVAGEARSAGSGPDAHPTSVQSKLGVTSVVLNRAETVPNSPSGNRFNDGVGSIDERIVRQITKPQFDSVGTPNYLAAGIPLDRFVAADWRATRDLAVPGKFGLTDSVIAATLARHRVTIGMPDDLNCEGVFFVTPPVRGFFKEAIESGRLEEIPVKGVVTDFPPPTPADFQFFRDTLEQFVTPREVCQ
jgi:hypothetical protein